MYSSSATYAQSGATQTPETAQTPAAAPALATTQTPAAAQIPAKKTAVSIDIDSIASWIGANLEPMVEFTRETIGQQIARLAQGTELQKEYEAVLAEYQQCRFAQINSSQGNGPNIDKIFSSILEAKELNQQDLIGFLKSNQLFSRFFNNPETLKKLKNVYNKAFTLTIADWVIYSEYLRDFLKWRLNPNTTNDFFAELNKKFETEFNKQIDDNSIKDRFKRNQNNNNNILESINNNSNSTKTVYEEFYEIINSMEEDRTNFDKNILVNFLTENSYILSFFTSHSEYIDYFSKINTTVIEIERHLSLVCDFFEEDRIKSKKNLSLSQKSNTTLNEVNDYFKYGFLQQSASNSNEYSKLIKWFVQLLKSNPFDKNQLINFISNHKEINKALIQVIAKIHAFLFFSNLPLDIFKKYNNQYFHSLTQAYPFLAPVLANIEQDLAEGFNHQAASDLVVSLDALKDESVDPTIVQGYADSTLQNTLQNLINKADKSGLADFFAEKNILGKAWCQAARELDTIDKIIAIIKWIENNLEFMLANAKGKVEPWANTKSTQLQDSFKNFNQGLNRCLEQGETKDIRGIKHHNPKDCFIQSLNNIIDLELIGTDSQFLLLYAFLNANPHIATFLMNHLDSSLNECAQLWKKEQSGRDYQPLDIAHLAARLASTLQSQSSNNNNETRATVKIKTGQTRPSTPEESPSHSKAEESPTLSS